MSIESARRGWRGAIAIYAQPRVRALLFLGFSAGLPFLLVFSTLSPWLTQAGVSRTTIGYFSWVCLTYSTKLFWAPVVDRVPLPLSTPRLARRRSRKLVAPCGLPARLALLPFCCLPSYFKVTTWLAYQVPLLEEQN